MLDSLRLCDICGKNAVTHIGKGVYVCAECGNQYVDGDPDDYDLEDGDCTWDEIWEERPVECIGCDCAGYPECIKSCSKVTNYFR